MISTATLPELWQEPPIVQNCSFLNLPLEIRLKIFEYLLPHLWMDCGYSPYGTQGIQAWWVLEPSSFFELVRTSKQICQETKIILEAVPVGINWTTLNAELQLSMWSGCVVGNVYRLWHATHQFEFPPREAGCDLGNVTFPNLRYVEVVCHCDHATSEPGHKLWHNLAYSHHLLPYVRQYLRSRTGASVDDRFELSERLRQGHGQAPDHLSDNMGEMVYAQIQQRVMSTYYFGIRVIVPLDWPYADDAAEVMYETFFEAASILRCRYPRCY
jgi:hypothetical protein